MEFVERQTFIVFIAFVEQLCGHILESSARSRLNFFDTDLLRYTAEGRGGNVMVSPASIKATLAMILEGSDGPTAAEIASALRLSPNKVEFREQLNLYLTALQADSKGVYLKNSNTVFVSNLLNLRKEYDMLLRSVYLADVCKIDFSKPLQASDHVNGWVNNATKGLISTIVEPAYITPSLEILLANAVYFKGNWEHAFDPKQTHAGCFHRQGLCHTAAMMELHAELKYAYVDDLRAHAVELPYEGGRYSMMLLVPQERDGCAGLIRDLPYMSPAQIYQLLEVAEVTLTMPKFMVDYSLDMIGPLNNMRINTLFSTKANLSGMFEGSSPHVESMFHKVHMTVDETGTVAAAASAVVVIPLMHSGVQLRVDRPFVFFIKDDHHGLVLFEGRIEEPTSFDEKNVSKV